MNRTFVAFVVAAALIGAAVAYIYWQLPDPITDPRELRARNRAILEHHAEALRAWRSERTDWPQSLRELRHFTRDRPEEQRLFAGSEYAPGVGLYRYQAPSDDDPHTLVMAASRGLPAVPAGTGLPDGGVLEQDLPEVHFVLRADLAVVELDPASHARQADFADEEQR